MSTYLEPLLGNVEFLLRGRSLVLGHSSAARYECIIEYKEAYVFAEWEEVEGARRAGFIVMLLHVVLNNSLVN